MTQTTTLQTHTARFCRTSALMIAALLLATLASCSSSRKAASTVPTSQLQQDVESTAIPAEWHTLQMPVKVNLEKPMGIGMSGRATMVADSLINVSLRVFGFEVAVVHATADSIWLVDKHNKMYVAQPLRSITGGRYDIGQLQHLILGQANQGQPLAFSSPHADVSLVFNDKTETLIGNIFQEINVKALLKGMDISASINWQGRQMKVNESVSPRFTPPGNNYRKIEASDLKNF